MHVFFFILTGFVINLSSSVLVIRHFIIFIRPSLNVHIMIWLCPSVRRCVRPSVRSVVHNSCGQDIARTMYPRMLTLCVCTSHGKLKKPLYFQGQISRSSGLYKAFWHLDPCGQDIARNILSGLFKLDMYTSFERSRSKVKFQGQWTFIKLLAHGSVWAGFSKNYATSVLELSMYTSYGKRKKPIYF